MEEKQQRDWERAKTWWMQVGQTTVTLSSSWTDAGKRIEAFDY